MMMNEVEELKASLQLARDTIKRMQDISDYEEQAIRTLMSVQTFGRTSEALSEEITDLFDASRIVPVRGVMSDGPGFIGDLFLIVYPDTSVQLVKHYTADFGAGPEWRIEARANKATAKLAANLSRLEQ